MPARARQLQAAYLYPLRSPREWQQRVQIPHATNPPYSIAMRPVPGGSGLGTLCSASIFEAYARLRMAQ